MQHGTVDAGARATGATHDGRGRCFGRALAAGVRPSAVDILRHAAGGRARRVEGAGLWSGPARACIGGAATVEALRPAVTGVVADGGADAGARGVCRLRSGGGSPGSARALRSTRAA